MYPHQNDKTNKKSGSQNQKSHITILDIIIDSDQKKYNTHQSKQADGIVFCIDFA